MRLVALLLVALLAAQSAQAASWVGSWGASPIAPQPAGDGLPAILTTPSFTNQTIVQVVRLSAGGQRLRIRFTNEFGRTALSIGRATVALLDAKGVTLPGSSRQIFFSGRGTAAIPSGAPLISDPVDLATPNLARLKVSIYLPGAAVECTCHLTGSQLVYTSPPGDYTDRPFEAVTATGKYRAFLSGVEVENPRPAQVIVTFGDSITDGYLSAIDGNKRYPDRLAERVLARWPSASVVNAGISGNRLISPGRWITAGPSALSRFDRDVLAVPGVTHVIILEGVNDLGGGGVNPPSADDLIAGYRQLIARAHARGIKTIGGTILPYGGATYYKAEGNAVRERVNAWIRASGEFDAVVDFDAAMRDPAQPTKLRADLQSGDWLHPNDAGYRAMGDAVDLRLLAPLGGGQKQTTARKTRKN